MLKLTIWSRIKKRGERKKLRRKKEAGEYVRRWKRKEQHTNITKGKSTMMRGQKGKTSQTFVECEKGEICSAADAYAQEILSYLSATNLQTLKTVCKDWLRLITSSYFVKLHLSRANQNRIRVLVPFTSEIMEYDNYNEGIKQIPYPPRFSGLNSTVLGSADGLICMVNEDAIETSPFTLFNPSTGKYFGVKLWLPTFTFHNIICFWFGKSVDGEYILVMGLFSPGPSYEFGVYKFTSSKLKRIHSTLVDMQIPYPGCLNRPDKGTLVHGAVHWAVRRCVDQRGRYLIMVYHIDENKYREMSPPAQCEFTLGVNVDGCLFAIHKNNNMQGVFEVWVMKECWTKYANIEGLNNSEVLAPLRFFPNGDLILDNDNERLIKYNFKDNKVELLMEYGSDRYGVVFCADTLVSPAILDC